MILPEFHPQNGDADSLQLRHRRKAKTDNIVEEVGAFVQEFDAFGKVADDVKEEPRIAKGILSVLCFSLIAILLIGQLHDYWMGTEVEYKFSVDTDYDDRPNLDLDMIVATPCNNLAIMPMGVDREVQQGSEGEDSDAGGGHLKKNPSRFEMNSEETSLWQTLQKMHKEHFKPGTPLKPVNEMTFVRKDVERGLRRAADIKQRLEMEQVEKQREEAKAKGDLEEGGGLDERFVLMIGNGLGIFQIISARMGDGNEVDEGTACRISGKVPVNKGNGDRLTIAVGKSLGFGNMVAHIGESKKSNISHRIERFHFGPHIWGLVTPLAGNEQITETGGTVYKYYIKVVPTKIYTPSTGGLFTKPTLTYQYSVTYTKKERAVGEHVHEAIIFDYEFTATMIEVHPVRISLLQLFLRVCSVVGGVFATSRFLEAFLSHLNKQLCQALGLMCSLCKGKTDKIRPESMSNGDSKSLLWGVH